MELQDSTKGMSKYNYVYKPNSDIGYPYIPKNEKYETDHRISICLWDKKMVPHPNHSRCLFMVVNQNV